MRLREDANEIILQETPGCLWVFGLFFVFVSGIFVYGSLGGLTDYDKQSSQMLALAFLMGSIGVAAGVWIISTAPITKIVVNRIENRVLLTRYGFSGKKETVYRFDEIKHFRLIEDKDDEGSPIWSFGIKLLNNDLIKITSLPSHSEEYERKYVFQINEFMHKPLPSYKAFDELEGESEPKIG